MSIRITCTELTILPLQEFNTMSIHITHTELGGENSEIKGLHTKKESNKQNTYHFEQPRPSIYIYTHTSYYAVEFLRQTPLLSAWYCNWSALTSKSVHRLEPSRNTSQRSWHHSRTSDGRPPWWETTLLLRPLFFFKDPCLELRGRVNKEVGLGSHSLSHSSPVPDKPYGFCGCIMRLLVYDMLVNVNGMHYVHYVNKRVELAQRGIVL